MGWRSRKYGPECRRKSGALWFLRRVTTICLCSLASLTAIQDTATAGQGYITAGMGGGPKALNSYQGIIYTPFGTFSDNGLILRAWNKAFRFGYKTSLQRVTNVPINTIGLSIEAEVGWQRLYSGGRIGIFGGVVWRDHILTPDDPNSILSKSRIGASVTLEAQHSFSNDYGVMGTANYIQNHDQYWVNFRPYKTISNAWKLGLDTAVLGGKDYNNVKLGLFVSDYEFSFWTKKRIFIGGQAGIQFSTTRKKETTPYAGVHIGYLF